MEIHFERDPFRVSEEEKQGDQNPQQSIKRPSTPRSSITRDRQSVSTWDHWSISAWGHWIPIAYRSISAWNHWINII